MQALVLAGGLGSRLSELTQITPKPMVKIGQKPILLHIFDIYIKHGVNNFVLCTGYLNKEIKKYFSKKIVNEKNPRIKIKNKKIYYKNKLVGKNKFLNFDGEIIIADTGKNTMTGGRVLKAKKFLKNSENFFLTYGDGLGNVNIKKLYKKHINKNKIATMTCVTPPGRFGVIRLNKKNSLAKSFGEKVDNKDYFINAGFFVLNKKIFSFIKDSKTIFEKEPLEKITKLKNLNIHIHYGFWKAMDTLKDKNELEKLSIKKPWLI